MNKKTNLLLTGQSEGTNSTLPKAHKVFGFYFRELMMRRGQASLEYFILLAVIAAIVIVSFTTFLPQIRKALQGDVGQDGYFQKAAKAITQ